MFILVINIHAGESIVTNVRLHQHLYTKPHEQEIKMM